MSGQESEEFLFIYLFEVVHTCFRKRLVNSFSLHDLISRDIIVIKKIFQS